MPDTRKHRGPHPDDKRLFGSDNWTELRRATGNLCWLLSRGYAITSSLKLVGDRYALSRRQRVAVSRCACADEAAARRSESRIEPDELGGRELWIDGYNLLTTIEAALSGGVILAARDGCYRDMASMHGSYRKVAETRPALRLIGEFIADWNVPRIRWLLDSPVSNSGRLKMLIQSIADDAGWNWATELARDPDKLLVESEQVVVSADSVVIDGARAWLNLARQIVAERIPEAYVVDLERSGD